MIRFLSKETYQKIAAGEVIDRPLAVVRELMDNAIDSKGDNIKVQIIAGGKKAIEVKDNGFGMSKDDIKICHLKHTTSKIINFDDIYKTTYMGFRGEALNAISIVSELTITSKNQDDSIGNSIIIKGGDIVTEKEVPTNRGTSIKVNHLFYNIPARARSLKSDISEFRHIKNIFIQKAIPHNNIGITLVNNEKTVFNIPKPYSILDRIKIFYGQELSDHLIPIDKDFDGFSISGFISKPNFFKGSKKYQCYYINNRSIFSNSMAHAVYLGYDSITPVGQYPVSFLFIKIDPKLIDVNVHPTKREVKLFNESTIHNELYQLIKNSVSKHPSLPKIEFKSNIKNSIKTYYNKKSKKLDLRHNAFVYKKSMINNKSNTIPNTDESIDYKIIGQLFNTYIVMEKDEELILLDQHAAHERLLYEQIKEKIGDNNIPSQSLLVPFHVDIPISDFEVIASKLDRLNSLGFQVDVFGDNSFIVNAIPYFLKLEKAKTVIEKLLDNISDKDIPSIKSFLDDTIKMKACRSAIKSGDSPFDNEISYLIKQLLKYDNPFACPHGRPTTLSLTKLELEQLFLRKK